MSLNQQAPWNIFFRRTPVAVVAVYYSSRNFLSFHATYWYTPTHLSSFLFFCVFLCVLVTPTFTLQNERKAVVNLVLFFVCLCVTGPGGGQRGFVEHPAHQGHRPRGHRVHHLEAADPLAHLQHRSALVRNEATGRRNHNRSGRAEWLRVSARGMKGWLPGGGGEQQVTSVESGADTKRGRRENLLVLEAQHESHSAELVFLSFGMVLASILWGFCGCCCVPTVSCGGSVCPVHPQLRVSCFPCHHKLTGIRAVNRPTTAGG